MRPRRPTCNFQSCLLYSFGNAYLYTFHHLCKYQHRNLCVSLSLGYGVVPKCRIQVAMWGSKKRLYRRMFLMVLHNAWCLDVNNLLLK